MNELLQRIRDLFDPGQVFVNVIDVLLVTYLVYKLLTLIRGTRYWRVVFGVSVFILALVVSDYLELRMLHWLLSQATLLGPVALVILFLPELRQAIEGFARLGLWPERFIGHEESIAGDALEEIVAAVAEMAEQRTGVLIVIERGTKLDDIAENGVPVKAKVTAPLLGAIFNDGSPLHDGAAIVRASQILAAACRLPLSENPSIDSHFHMRHRAGIGISEQADCVVVIVSEERGLVSAAIEGRLISLPSGKSLRELLNHELRGGLSRRKPKRRKPRPGVDHSVEKVG